MSNLRLRWSNLLKVSARQWQSPGCPPKLKPNCFKNPSSPLHDYLLMIHAVSFIYFICNLYLVRIYFSMWYQMGLQHCFLCNTIYWIVCPPHLTTVHITLNVYTRKGFWVFSSMPQTFLLVLGPVWQETITFTPGLRLWEDLRSICS